MYKLTYLVSHEMMKQQLMVVVESSVATISPVTDNRFDQKCQRECWDTYQYVSS